MERNEKICGKCRCWIFRERDEMFTYGDCHYEPKIISKNYTNFCIKGFEWNDKIKQRTAKSN